PPLVVGEGEMQLLFYDHGTGDVYPPELQPQITPTKNKFQYHQLNNPERLFLISGEFEAQGIAQIDNSVLESYNTDNSTSFGVRPIEKIVTPIANTSGRDIPLTLIGEYDWINIDTGNVTDHVEPLFAVWEAGSNEMMLKFDRNTYSVIFGNTLTWNAKLCFRGIDYLDIEQ
ncbi:MAG: hypothetical protein F6K48_12970, partial [Okeania sp. SIO3H1]|nr:hypothetical protein [Okeania sp. SIO3H1]